VCRNFGGDAEKAIALKSEIGQLEGVLWATEGLAVIAIEKAQYSEAQSLMQEAQTLRKSLEVPVLPHTLKYILPKLIRFQNGSKTNPRPFARVMPKPPVTNANLAVASEVSVAPLVANNLGGISLSEREIEVLKLVAEGHPNSQIAKLLVISPGTVNNHLSSIYSKFGVNSRTAAIRHALDHRLL
jgi:DNA-binding CsgD family transcriptional regulator